MTVAVDEGLALTPGDSLLPSRRLPSSGTRYYR
jgi:hypothetical protein